MAQEPRKVDVVRLFPAKMKKHKMMYNLHTEKGRTTFIKFSGILENHEGQKSSYVH